MIDNLARVNSCGSSSWKPMKICFGWPKNRRRELFGWLISSSSSPHPFGLRLISRPGEILTNHDLVRKVLDVWKDGFFDRWCLFGWLVDGFGLVWFGWEKMYSMGLFEEKTVCLVGKKHWQKWRDQIFHEPWLERSFQNVDASPRDYHLAERNKKKLLKIQHESLDSLLHCPTSELCCWQTSSPLVVSR